jgi:hypothetical protein
MCRLLGESAFFRGMESGYDPDLALAIELINVLVVNAPVPLGTGQISLT